MTDGLALHGIDGSNPLGFLTAIGVLRTATRILPTERVTLHWSDPAGFWRPVLGASVELNQDGLLDALADGLDSDAEDHAVGFLKDVHGAAPETIQSFFHDAATEVAHDSREHADLLVAMASDVNTEAVSQLQTVRRDYFWGNLQSVVEKSDREHLRRTLFEPWDYADGLDNQSLHLEPSEDRRHALQWNKPSGDPDRKRRGGMLGANRLAIEAFALFPSLPREEKLQTTGFHGIRADTTRWTWPIWSAPATVDVARSLLTLPELQGEEIPAEDLAARGIVAAFRSRRILFGKTPNFTPSVRL